MHMPEVRIGEDGGRAALLVDGVVQSISPADGLVEGGYWAAMLPSGRPHSALSLGLGGGTLARMLQDSGIKWRVVVVSACYSGGFIEPLFLDASHAAAGRLDRPLGPPAPWSASAKGWSCRPTCSTERSRASRTIGDRTQRPSTAL